MRRERLLPLLFVALPVFLAAAVLIGPRVPARWRNLFFLGAAAVVATIVFVVPVRAAKYAERKAGIVARGQGYSDKLAIAAERLRANAAELDEDPDAGASSALVSYIKELRRVARAQDKVDLLPSFSVRNADAAQMRKAAAELDAYASRVRGKGGIFQLETSQLVAGAAALVVMFACGAWLMWRTWSTPSFTFIGGAALIAIACVLGYGLYGSQRDAA